MPDEPNPTTPAAENSIPAPETPALNGDAPGTQAGAGKTFTQTEVDALIAQRLTREREKAQKDADKARTEAERKAAEESGNWKALYEKQQADLAAAQEKARALELATVRRDVAGKVGLPPALAERLHGETPEEMEEDARTLLAALPKPGAPNINGTGGASAPASGYSDEERKRLASIYGVSAKHFGAQ